MPATEGSISVEHPLNHGDKDRAVPAAEHQKKQEMVQDKGNEALLVHPVVESIGAHMRIFLQSLPKMPFDPSQEGMHARSSLLGRTSARGEGETMQRGEAGVCLHSPGGMAEELLCGSSEAIAFPPQAVKIEDV